MASSKKDSTEDTQTVTEEDVTAAFPGAETVSDVDRDWPEQPAAAVATVAERNVTLNLPSGTTLPMTVDALKQLSFDQISGMDVMTADDELATDQFGAILEDKGKLVGVPFVILHWVENEKGDFGAFTTMYVLTQSEDRFIVNDGSTGIHAQLAALKARTGMDSMLVCKHGLRASTYDKELPNGKTTRATTYYIDTAVKA